MKWQDKLTKKDLAHLRVSGVTTLSGAKINAEYQKRCRADGDPEPCFDCKSINMKLDLPV